jgi:hypothetical protein
LKKETYFFNPTFSARQITWRSLKWLQVIERDYVWWFIKKTPHLLCPCIWWTWIWKLAILQISCHRKSIEKSHSFSLTKDGDIAMA